VAINETIRLMAEIDKVIEAHGGWPGAFDTSGKASAAVQKQGNDQSTKLVAFPAKPEPEKHYDTEPEAVEVAAELPQPAYRSIDETEREELMADIRDLFESPEAQNGLDRDEALRRLNDALGFRRLGPHIREVLENDLLAAARRGIVETRNSRLFLVTRSIDNYDRDFLKNQFLASLGQVWRAREEAAVRFARWLGFRRTGANIQAMVKSLINGLLREGRLEAEDSRIRHCK
jgi:hypothetical protein